MAVNLVLQLYYALLCNEPVKHGLCYLNSQSNTDQPFICWWLILVFPHCYTITLFSNDAKYNYRYQIVLKPTAVVHEGDIEVLIMFIWQRQVSTNLQRDKTRSQEGRWHRPGPPSTSNWIPLPRVLVSWLLKEETYKQCDSLNWTRCLPSSKTRERSDTYAEDTLPEASLVYLRWQCLIRGVHSCVYVLLSICVLPFFSPPALPL